MKKTHKALLMTMCAVLLVATSILGTVAYLTSTDLVTNTFTVGTVEITLDEADVKVDGTYETNETNRVTENVYHLLPGHSYIKDPQVHVAEGSEDCYLFVKVENGIEAIEAATVEGGYTNIADQMKKLGWAPVEDAANVYVLMDGTNKKVVSGGNDVTVFENFKIDGAKVVNVPTGGTVPAGKLNIEAYKDAKIVVTAYAVQKDGFETQTARQIWDAAFGA